MEAREWYAEHGEKAEIFLTHYFEYRETAVLKKNPNEQHQRAMDYALNKSGLSKHSQCFYFPRG